jgi:hypothetical protein
MSDFAKTVIALAVIAMITSCASSESPSGVMGNTNWLTSCDEDDDCDDDLSCSCGVCTRQCTTTSDCSELGGSVCDVQSEALASACGSSIAMSVCLPACRNDNDCGGGLECVAAHCLPAEVVAASPGVDGDGDGGTSIGCGPNGAFISAHVAPDEDCIVSAEGSPQLAIGSFDVSSGFNGDDGNCNTGYRVNLLTYSCLQGANDTLQLHSAEVLLKVPSGETILFDRLDPPLPNPFLVVGNSTIFPMRDDGPSSGVITIEAIPTAYAEQLDDFDGQQVHAEIRVYGTTVGGSDVDLNPFLYPIEICDGCLTLCVAAIPPDATADEIYGEGVCRDNASADGRICVDTSCVTFSGP